MATERPWVSQNTVQRDRLRGLVARLSDEDLRRPLPAGWTIAAALAHLAFWDQRILVLIERWERTGPAALPPPLDHGDVDWINDAAKALCLALPPRTAAQLAVTTAEAVDAKLAALADDRVAANAAAGSPINPLRADHRRQHLDEIDQALRG